jgi:deoxyribose-phosphate aldolase
MSQDLARFLDAAVLKPETTLDEARDAIGVCLELNTKTVCVRPCDVPLASELCAGSDTGVCVVLGFPHGCGLTAGKAAEARLYRDLGVSEIDMVASFGRARSGAWDEVRDDIQAVADAAGDVPVKVIFETAHLDEPQTRRLVDICVEAGAAFVKTSTGFNGDGASEAAVRTMLDQADGRIQVKPSGGIRDAQRARMFLDLGATRLGVGWSSCEAIVRGGAAGGSGY